MTAEQLQAARAAHWRQQKNPILTLDDAAHWLEQHPLCLYLPRRAQLPAPAPSFVEAVLGTAAATPGTDAIAQAQGLLTRLIDSGTVVALNLFGTVGEQPDFLVARQALPYVLCLRADADWKHAPEKSSGHKVSPLVLELWKALNQKGDQDGALTAPEARETLGRELTEAAVLRGLGELWQGLRIAPVFEEPGQPARWELLRVKHRDALATAGATGQVTALSLLVSIYLQSVYAATSEEIEIFLSPLASRSRVREAVRGLSATRQVQSLSMDAQTYYFLEGGLPEFAESAVPIAAAAPLPGPAAVSVSAPQRPLPGPRPAKDQGISPASRQWKKPGEGEKSTVARPSFPPRRSFPPPPGPGAKPSRGGQRNEGPPRRAARPGLSPGRETKPARPEVSREWRKPPLAGKPAATRPAYPSRSFPPAPAQGGEKRAPQRSDAAARGGAGVEKRFASRPEKPGGERPAPWARSGPKPPFRSSPRPRADRPADRAHGRPSGSLGERRRPEGPGPGRAAGAAPPMGRPSGRPPASFRSKPGARPGGKPGASRPGGSGPRRSGPAPGDGRPGGQIGPPRSSDPGSRPPRPLPAREGDSRLARPPSGSSSRPTKPWQRTGPSAARGSGRPGSKPEGRFGGKSGGKPGGKPANFERRKAARKKPGA